MKLAIFTNQLELMGGIERVVVEHLRIFTAHCAEVFLFIGQPIELLRDKIPHGVRMCVLPQSKKQRAELLRQELVQFNPDAVIFHSLLPNHQEDADVDVSVCNALDIKSIAVVHFVFNAAMMLSYDQNANFNMHTRSMNCTALATVSKIDEAWWRALGHRAFHVQNPFVRPAQATRANNAAKHAPTLFWIGRICEQKMPEEAIKVMAALVKIMPEAKLRMVGGNVNSKRWVKGLLERCGLENNVEAFDETPDVERFWSEADFHLLTSCNESFGLVIAEAKAHGIPTAMYRLPYLDLVRAGGGLIEADFLAAEKLAEGIAAAWNDKAQYSRLCREAKESLADFNDENVWESWTKLFEAIKRDDTGREVSSELAAVAPQIYAAWEYHRGKSEWLWTMHEDFISLTRYRFSLKGLARLLKWIVETLGKIRGH